MTRIFEFDDAAAAELDEFASDIGFEPEQVLKLALSVYRIVIDQNRLGYDLLLALNGKPEYIVDPFAQMRRLPETAE